MADEPNNLVIAILREIQAKQAEHDRRFEKIDQRFEDFEDRVNRRFERVEAQMDHRFDRVDHELTDLLDHTIKTSGEASMALVRHENVQRQFADMETTLREVKDRLRRLEEKV